MKVIHCGSRMDEKVASSYAQVAAEALRGEGVSGDPRDSTRTFRLALRMEGQPCINGQENHTLSIEARVTEIAK
jgi:hypothetical protein